MNAFFRNRRFPIRVIAYFSVPMGRGVWRVDELLELPVPQQSVNVPKALVILLSFHT